MYITFRCEELFPSVAVVQAASSEAFWLLRSWRRRGAPFEPRNVCEAKAGQQRWGMYAETNLTGYTKVIKTDTHTVWGNIQWAKQGLSCSDSQTTFSSLVGGTKSLQWAGWWLIMPDNNVLRASRLLNMTKQSIGRGAASIPELPSTSTERCKTTKRNTSLMLWLLMFSCRWSAVYLRHPSPGPTCLFAFSLHLYSEQMSSQGAACLSQQHHGSSAWSSARIKLLYMSPNGRIQNLDAWMQIVAYFLNCI